MNNEKIKKIIKSENVKRFGYGVIFLVVLVVIFHVGSEFGYNRAKFFAGNNKSYSPFDKGPRHGGPMGFLNDGTSSTHGVVGKIININPPKITVEDKENIEKVILTSDDTIIRRFRDEILISDLDEGDVIVTLGKPNENSEIEARLVRVLPPPPEN